MFDFQKRTQFLDQNQDFYQQQEKSAFHLQLAFSSLKLEPDETKENRCLRIKNKNKNKKRRRT